MSLWYGRYVSMVLSIEREALYYLLSLALQRLVLLSFDNSLAQYKAIFIYNMSADQTEAADICCASCDIAELDDIKLMDCDACDLVKYCSDECQQEHRPQHELRCKERAAELRDEILFRQPESTHLEAVIMPTCCVRDRRGCNKHVHSVGALCLIHRKRPSPIT
eukprot:scaffold26313_cov80-Skeletonema_marinoi.AAC.1